MERKLKRIDIPWCNACQEKECHSTNRECAMIRIYQNVKVPTLTLDEYIAENWQKNKLNEYSIYSGWPDAILDIVREVWNAAQSAKNMQNFSDKDDNQS